MCICFSFQQNNKVGMTVRTCICNVFECEIQCKIYTYLLHLCYIRCKLRCWIFVACSHRFLLPKSTFSWIGHPANLFQLFPCCLSSFYIKIDQYETSMIKYQVLWYSNFHQKDVRKKDVLSRLPLNCSSFFKKSIGLLCLLSFWESINSHS